MSDGHPIYTIFNHINICNSGQPQ